MRLKRFGITPEALLGFFGSLNGQRVLTCAGLPPDARFVRAWLEDRPDLHTARPTGVLWLVVESESFPVVPEGSLIPEGTLEISVREEG